MRATRVTLLAALLPAILAASGTLKVRILDTDRQAVTAARVNVIGSDNAFYEPDPAQNPLSGYSLKRKGNRGNVTPLRYFGSFFYTSGAFEVKLPPGTARIEVTKGFDYYKAIADVKIEEGKTAASDIVLQRVIDMPRAGWRSTDTHLHFDRGAPTADAEIFQLLSAEDVELGHILTRESAKGWGMDSLNTQGRYAILSGREATSAGLGHVNMLLFHELPSAVRNQNSPPPGFPLASLYDQVIAAGGAMQHDHAGYGQEIYSDVVLGKSDAVELLQFALYRPEIGIDGYYLLLNSGYRYPLLGGSDYPVCRTMSDSRTFVADGTATNFPTSVGRLIRGESFATSGPLLFLSVNGKGPGSDLEFSGTSPQQVTVQVKAASGDLPFEKLEIIQDGRVVSEGRGSELKTTLKLNASSWIAARCSGPQTVHAHTNPVWIYFNGRAPYQPDAARELKNRIHAYQATNISSAVKQVAQDAETKVPQSAPERPKPITRFPVTPSNTTLLPAVLPKPKPLPSSTIEGTVVDKSGQPISGVTVSVRATGPSTTSAASGQFKLSGVDANMPLYLHLAKSGYATTNTQYLNPRTTKDNVRIVMLTNAAPAQGTIAIEGVPTGIELTASPAGITQFKPVSEGLVIGTTKINFQPAYPQPSNDFEPNVIISAEGLGKDLVLPVFAGQVTYVKLSSR